MKKTNNAAATIASVLTAAMIAENENTRQTMWVAFGKIALRFRKLYVPEVPRGSVFGLFRTVEGAAYLITRSETTPSLDSFDTENAVTINARRLDVFVRRVDASVKDNLDVDGALVGFMLDEARRCYRVTRAPAYDNEGYEVK